MNGFAQDVFRLMMRLAKLLLNSPCHNVNELLIWRNFVEIILWNGLKRIAGSLVNKVDSP